MDPKSPRPKVDPRDLDFAAALNHAEQLVRTLKDAGYRAPELLPLTLREAAHSMNGVAAALRFTGGPKTDDGE